MDKQELRRELLGIRQALQDPERTQAAANLCLHVSQMPEYISAKQIALYWPHNHEIDCQPLIQQSLKLHKKCFLPVLCLKNRQSLAFAAYDQYTTMVKNRYGIPEPDMDNTSLIATNELDIIFVPLVGFDRSGWRLGRGGGFYDATFSDLARLKSTHIPKLIGLGFDCQEVRQIPIDSWDWRLNIIVTESRVLRF